MLEIIVQILWPFEKPLFSFCYKLKFWLHFVPLQKLLCRHKNQFLWIQIIFLSDTKCLWLAQYVNKFLVRHKKFGPAQNILGPVEGQGVADLYWSLNILCRSKNSIPFSAFSKIFVPAQKPNFLNGNHLLMWHKMFETGTKHFGHFGQGNREYIPYFSIEPLRKSMLLKKYYWLL